MKQAFRRTYQKTKLIHLIQIFDVFKIFHGFDNIHVDYYVATDLTDTTPNNGFKIIGKRFRSNEAKHFSLIES